MNDGKELLRGPEGFDYYEAADLLRKERRENDMAVVSSPMPVTALQRGTEYELWVKVSPGDPNGTLRKAELRDLQRFGLRGPDDTPCEMCQTNNGKIRFDHTTDDHANFEPGP